MMLDGTVTSGQQWSVVIPVKALSTAKSRMDASARDSGELALAFFLDTLAAALACPPVLEILVATSDVRVAEAARAAGCTVVPDTGFPGINAAARHAAEQRSGSDRVAVVVSDLPCLTASSLTAALTAAADHPTAFLADADGLGTTMWFSTDGRPPEPHFGEGSRAAHVAAGAVDLVHAHPGAADLDRARRDVDTPEALREARRLGLGERTTSVLDRASARIVTVAHSDGETVTVVDESGRLEAVPRAAVAEAGLRVPHPGQRLVLRDGADTGGVHVALP
jgi:2-phospho-L-lactate guanylyltransferase